MAESLHKLLTGSGASIGGAIRIDHTSIAHLPPLVIAMAVGSISTMKGKTMKKDLMRAAESWAKAFLAAALATYLAVGWDVNAIVTSAATATLPSIINWLNPNYTRYGRVK